MKMSDQMELPEHHGDYVIRPHGQGCAVWLKLPVTDVRDYGRGYGLEFHSKHSTLAMARVECERLARQTMIESEETKQTKQAGHTPGRYGWDVGCGSIESGRVVFAAPPGSVHVTENVVVATAHGRTDAELEANARLIAAAPELLAALEGLAAEIKLRKLNIRKDFSLINAHAAALKAITKATT